ncbi:MAG TPA: hypothetical protein VGG33_21660 [Polyangia bacterium]
MNHESNDGQILKSRSTKANAKAKVKADHTCATCGAAVNELRRGRCWACYARWQEQRPVGLGASCAVCEERRRDNMRLVEVQGRSLALCHICAAHVAKLEVVPYSIEGLRSALRRDRRHVERREGDPVEPHAVERRAARRRAGTDSGVATLGEDAVVYTVGAGDLDLDLDLDAEGAVPLDEADIVEDVTVIAMEPESKPSTKADAATNEPAAEPVSESVVQADSEIEAPAAPASATMQADAG